nr:MAG TPA: hypothetical protein [Caudoviricetes sp.]
MHFNIAKLQSPDYHTQKDERLARLCLKIILLYL